MLKKVFIYYTKYVFNYNFILYYIIFGDKLKLFIKLIFELSENSKT